jgi:hypothetical protein
MQFIGVLNQNSGAINVILTLLYVLATLAMVFFMFRANHLTRKNIDLLTMLELERMRPQLYFDLFTDNYLLFARLKNYGATAAFDIEIKLEPKVEKKHGNEKEGLKLTSMKIAYLPPEKELEEFIDAFHQFALGRPDLKFRGRLKYRSANSGKYYDEEIYIDLSVHQVPFVSKKVVAEELETIGNHLEKLVSLVKERSMKADVTK